ncbi:unnamed protein product [Amoebophrya sp. A25]|nr:unnamed protein product [Amoebophrya sp. A25]|eukprot:GSA25T00010337001.1
MMFTSNKLRMFFLSFLSTVLLVQPVSAGFYGETDTPVGSAWHLADKRSARARQRWEQAPSGRNSKIPEVVDLTGEDDCEDDTSKSPSASCSGGGGAKQGADNKNGGKEDAEVAERCIADPAPPTGRFAIDLLPQMWGSTAQQKFIATSSKLNEITTKAGSSTTGMATSGQTSTKASLLKQQTSKDKLSSSIASANIKEQHVFRICYLDTENSGLEPHDRIKWKGEPGATKQPEQVKADFLLEIAARVVEVDTRTGKVREITLSDSEVIGAKELDQLRINDEFTTSYSEWLDVAGQKPIRSPSEFGSFNYLGLEEPDREKFRLKFGRWEDYEVESNGAFAVNMIGYEDDPKRVVREKTGIRGVKGKKIDWRKVGALMEISHFIVAHNADYDFRFIARDFPPAAYKQWLCSLKDIDWPLYVPPEKLPLKNFKAESLSEAFGIEAGQHDALSDITACLQILEKSQTYGPLIKRGQERMREQLFYEIGWVENELPDQIRQSMSWPEKFFYEEQRMADRLFRGSMCSVTTAATTLRNPRQHHAQTEIDIFMASAGRTFSAVFLNPPGPKPWEKNKIDPMTPEMKKAWIQDASASLNEAGFLTRKLYNEDTNRHSAIVYRYMSRAEILGEKQTSRWSGAKPTTSTGGGKGSNPSPAGFSLAAGETKLPLGRSSSPPKAEHPMRQFYDVFYGKLLDSFNKSKGRPQRGHYWFQPYYPVLNPRLRAGFDAFPVGMFRRQAARKVLEQSKCAIS